MRNGLISRLVVEDEAFRAMAIQNDDQELLLKALHCGVDVLDVMRCVMALASWTSHSPECRDGIPKVTPPAGFTMESDAATPDELLYSSVPFQGKDNQIRLIELLPGEAEDSINIRLFVVDKRYYSSL